MSSRVWKYPTWQYNRLPSKSFATTSQLKLTETQMSYAMTGLVSAAEMEVPPFWMTEHLVDIEGATVAYFNVVQYVAQVPATLVCNRPNFLFMHRNFLILLQETVHLLNFKMYGDRLPTSSTKEIMPFFAKLVSCPVSGQRVQFPAINIESRNFIQFA